LRGDLQVIAQRPAAALEYGRRDVAALNQPSIAQDCGEHQCDSAPGRGHHADRACRVGTDPVRYSGDISVVGQPNANTGKVMYPSRPSGRTPLAALSSSAEARSSVKRLRTGGAVLQLATHDLAGAAAR
jgi:hypothetical protein